MAPRKLSTVLTTEARSLVGPHKAPVAVLALTWAFNYAIYASESQRNETRRSRKMRNLQQMQSQISLECHAPSYSRNPTHLIQACVPRWTSVGSYTVLHRLLQGIGSHVANFLKYPSGEKVPSLKQTANTYCFTKIFA
jgi:hypothetical protein